MITAGVLGPEHSKARSQGPLMDDMKSLLGPLTHTFQDSSNHLVVAVVVDVKFQRHSLAPKRLNVVRKFLGCGRLEIKRAKTARGWITKAW
jgi:hypothetical protein